MPTQVRRRSSDGIDRAASADGADRLNGAARSSRGGNRSTQREDDPAPIIPILARRVREVEARVASKGRATPTNRTKFQVVALLMRAERARVKDDQVHFDRYAGRPAQAARRHRRHPGPDRRSGHESAGTARPGCQAGPAAQQMRRDWLLESGAELAPEDLVITRPQPVAQVMPPELAAKQVTPPAVPARTRANPFLAPDLSKETSTTTSGGCRTGSCSARCTAPSSRAPAARPRR